MAVRYGRFVGVLMSHDLRARLAAVAEWEGVTVSAVVRQLVEAGLTRERRRD